MGFTEPDSAPVAPGQMPVSQFSILAPYSGGSPDPVYAGGDADAGGRDDVAATVAEAQANAEARYHEHQADTYGQGSRIGDYITLPEVPSFGSKHTGGSDAGYPALEGHDDHTG
jgi:hypothetical protein